MICLVFYLPLWNMEQWKRAYEEIAVSICRIRSLSPKRPVAPSILDGVLKSINFGICTCQLFFCAIEPAVYDSRDQEALGFAAKIAGFNGTQSARAEKSYTILLIIGW